MARAFPQAWQAQPPQALPERARERGASARRLAALREQEQFAEAVPRQEFWEQQPAPFFQTAKALWRAPAAREQEPVAAREAAGPAREELAQIAVLASSSH